MIFLFIRLDIREQTYHGLTVMEKEPLADAHRGFSIPFDLPDIRVVLQPVDNIFLDKPGEEFFQPADSRAGSQGFSFKPETQTDMMFWVLIADEEPFNDKPFRLQIGDENGKFSSQELVSLFGAAVY